MNKEIYEYVKCSDCWYIKKKGGFLKSPGGLPLGSTSKKVIVQVCKHLNQFGNRPSEYWSLYSLLCSYYDFASADKTEKLISSLCSAFEYDPLYREVAFITAFNNLSISEMLGDEIYSFFSDIGLFSAWNEENTDQGSMIHLTPLLEMFKKELGKYSRKGVMTFVYFTAHFGAPFTLLAYLHNPKTYKTCAKLLRRDRMEWPFLPNELNAQMKMLAEFAKSEDDMELIIFNFPAHKSTLFCEEYKQGQKKKL